MQLGMKLNQHQTMQLTLTPELRQSINILQYSSFELIEFLQQQAVENPILDIKESVNHDFFAHTYSKSSFSSFDGENDFDPILHYSDTNITLEKHLMEQIMTLHSVTSEQKRRLIFLIGHLNQHGFLEIEPAIAANMQSVTLEEMEEAIVILQSLDPLGVGARDFKESLLIQMRADIYSPSLAYQMIENHLEDVAAKRYLKISKLYDVTVQEVQEAADYIKTLNPRPCSEFNHEMTQYIMPDIVVENIKDEYIIIVNDSLIPQLSISQFYKNDKMATEYLKEKRHEAMILMNGIAQRKYTLYKVTEAIIKKQKDFLKHGMSELKPMTLKDISEQLGFHESTISRATSNKYIQTQHGLFKLKSLFTKGLTRSNSLETESSVVIKEKIKTFIDKENKQQPISDQMMVKLLQQNGIEISRRTVAKYREEMEIPGSSKRRRY